MKRIALYLGLATTLMASCSTKEIDFQTPVQEDVMFFASFERPSKDGTRVYVNEDLLLRWTTDDRVSIFNKNTYNQQYKFAGATGDNSGGFDKVEGSEFVTGNAISHVVSVYPYDAATRISESETLTLTLPAEQHYAENTFGLGANTMVSVSSDNFLQYKNVGGYLMLKLYGDGVSVYSITLKGNNGEKLAGKASVAMPLDGMPTVVMADDATTEITLTCESPVQLGTSAKESTPFWFVVPPVTFSKGFTIIVNTGSDDVFVQSTSKSIAIERNRLSKMSPMAVTILDSRRVIFYTSTDGKIITPSSSAFGANIVSNEYIGGVGVLSFDGDVTSIGKDAFNSCNRLASITIPETVTQIGDFAFYGCGLSGELCLPKGITTIGNSAFSFCRGLSGDLILPESLVSLGTYAFKECSAFSGNLVFPSGLSIISEGAFSGCSGFSGKLVLPEELISIEGEAFGWCTGFTGELVLPAGLTSVGGTAFYDCKHFSGELVLPEGLTSIGDHAFYYCTGLTSMRALPAIPPTGADSMFGWNYFSSIYVPYGSVDAYKTAEYWKDYAHQIRAIPPEAIDLGLPSGVKWASFNLGASKPEEYGDYYAWGETEPYYSNLDPLTWKEGNESGYNWASYKWCMGSENTMTKYCFNSSYGYEGFTDTKTVLDLEDDAAHMNLGGNWRMPTTDEWTELRENCTWTLTTQNGIAGRLVTASNGNCIFLPAAGCWDNTDLLNVGSYGIYWSSSLNMDGPKYAWDAYFYSGGVYRAGGVRGGGFSVRPVCAE